MHKHIGRAVIPMGDSVSPEAPFRPEARAKITTRANADNITLTDSFISIILSCQTDNNLRSLSNKPKAIDAPTIMRKTPQTVFIIL